MVHKVLGRDAVKTPCTSDFLRRGRSLPPPRSFLAWARRLHSCRGCRLSSPTSVYHLRRLVPLLSHLDHVVHIGLDPLALCRPLLRRYNTLLSLWLGQYGNPPPSKRCRDGGCICVQRLPYFVDGLIGRLSNNFRDSFDREFLPNVFDQHRHPP